MMRIAKAGVVYFALVFGAGFVLGVIRTLWIAPHVGTRLAELIEMPVMLGVILVAARWTVRRLSVPAQPSLRLGMGLLALGLLLVAELSLVLGLRGLTLEAYLATRDPVAGTVYYLMLGVFALMPLFDWPQMILAAAGPCRRFPPGGGCFPRGRIAWTGLLAGASALAVSLDRELRISWGAPLGDLGAAGRYCGRATGSGCLPEGPNPDLVAPIRLAAGGIVVQSSGLERTFERRFDSSSKSPDPHMSQHTPFSESGCLIYVRVGGL